MHEGPLVALQVSPVFAGATHFPLEHVPAAMQSAMGTAVAPHASPAFARTKFVQVLVEVSQY